ncbi:MAG: LLM class flavin-dependent oxidoreductase [Methylocystaceae bacterium]|nr:MAG: LLM class flavin-dependent oxidoreductase [Methylocystaceae bacterium]
MADPLKILWYIRHNDGPYPWAPEGAFPKDQNRVNELARAVDELGFYGALVVGDSPFIEISSFIPITKQMRFLIPIYPGQYPPATLVKQAKEFDRLSGGRLLFNQVNGTDLILPQFGVNYPSDQRYDFSAEYWDVFKRLYAGEIGSFKGKYLEFGAPPPPRGAERRRRLVQDPYTPVWGTGTSPAGVEHAGKVIDTFLTYLHRPDRLGEQMNSARAVAKQHGRTIKVGTLANIIVRETEEEAWAHAQWLLEKTGVERLIRGVDERLKMGRYNKTTGSRKAEAFDSLHSDDPKIQSRIDALRAGRLPDLRSLESYPNIWSGPNGQRFDLLDLGYGGYLVGSGENVAARIKELQRDLGLDTFIFMGFPLIEEAKNVARYLLPLLDLDKSPPVLTEEKIFGEYSALPTVDYAVAAHS